MKLTGRGCVISEVDNRGRSGFVSEKRGGLSRPRRRAGKRTGSPARAVRNPGGRVAAGRLTRRRTGLLASLHRAVKRHPPCRLPLNQRPCHFL